jgi:hypothetical protein
MDDSPGNLMNIDEHRCATKISSQFQNLRRYSAYTRRAVMNPNHRICYVFFCEQFSSQNRGDVI